VCYQPIPCLRVNSVITSVFTATRKAIISAKPQKKTNLFIYLFILGIQISQLLLLVTVTASRPRAHFTLLKTAISWILTQKWFLLPSAPLLFQSMLVHMSWSKMDCNICLRVLSVMRVQDWLSGITTVTVIAIHLKKQLIACCPKILSKTCRNQQ
jgi:hypothetical protein